MFLYVLVMPMFVVSPKPRFNVFAALPCGLFLLELVFIVLELILVVIWDLYQKIDCYMSELNQIWAEM